MKNTILLFAILFIGIIANAQWTQLNTGTTENLNSIHFINDTVGFVAGNEGTILKTIDGGSNWNDIYTLNTASFYSIHAIDEDTIYIGGNSGLYKTIDGGLNWSHLNFTSQVQEINFISPKKGYVFIDQGTWCGDFSLDGGKYYETNDYGSSWSVLGYQMLSNAGIQFMSDSVGYILGNQLDCGVDGFGGRGLIKRTDDGGMNWATTYPFPYEGPPDFYFINDTLGYFGLGGFTKTYDGGITNTSITTSIPGTGLRKDIKFTNEHEGYLTRGTEILKTTSDGVAWAVDYSGTVSLSELYIIDTTVAYCIGDSGVILKKELNPVNYSDSIYNIAVYPTSLSFGQIMLGSNTSSFFQIINTGNMDLQVSLSAPIGYTIEIEGSGGLYSQSISPFNLPATSDTIINVIFAPSNTEYYNDTIVISSNATNQPTINLLTFGEGVNGLIGNILNDTLLCADTIRIIGDVYIDSSATVTICPGTVVEFQDYYDIECRGKIIAISNATDSIIFTSKDTFSGWGGINLKYNSVDSSIFQYCQFKYCSSNAISLNYYNSITIEYCQFFFNNSPIYINSGKAEIKRCDIFNNNSAAIRINSGISNPVLINNCRIFNNFMGIEVSHNSKIIISNNLIYNNGSGGAIEISYSGAEHYIYNNVIFNNYSTYSSPGGITIKYSYNVQIYNNTIANNHSLVPVGGIFFDENGANCVAKNNIIHGNSGVQVKSGTMFGDENFSALVENNNIQGGYPGLGNIDSYPQFIDPITQIGFLTSIPSFDWGLQSTSPCINAGTPDTTGLHLPIADIAGNNRVYDCVIDMGAYEFQDTVDISFGPLADVCENDPAIELTTGFPGGFYSGIGVTNSMFDPSVAGAGTHTISFSSGCNTSLTQEINILPLEYASIDISSCDSFASPSGIYTWTNTGTYYDTIPNMFACDSIITINLTINTVDTSVEQNDGILTSNVTGAEYQWLICDSLYTIINGETNQSFTPISIESYAVIITQNGCSDTSDCYTFTAISNIENNNEIFIYPNPTKGLIIVEADRITMIEVLDIKGREVYSGKETEINLSQEPKGIYILKVRTDKYQAVRKVVLE